MCLGIVSISKGYSSKVCPDLTISGAERICESTVVQNIGTGYATPGKIYDYEVNYDRYHIIRWEVRNGDIVLVDGKDTTSFLQHALAKSPYAAYYSGNPSYNNQSGARIPPYTVYLTWVWGGSYSVSVDFIGGPSITSVLGGLAGGFVRDLLEPREAQQISIMWDGYQSDYAVTAHIQAAGLGGVCASHVYTKNVVRESNPFSTAIVQGSSDLYCNQGVQISGNINASSINWLTSGAVVTSNWGAGIYIDRFTHVGQVPIVLVASNSCGSLTKTFTFNITQPDFGHVTQNINGNNVNVDVPGSVVTLDCQGNFYLAMPWVASTAVYTWELPDEYDIYTNTYSRKIISGNNMTNIQGKLVGGFTDFVGKVTVTGVCGAPVVRTFIIRPTTKPTVDADIYSCTNSVLININNPNGTSNVYPWVVYPTSAQYTISNNTPTSVQFTATAGTYGLNFPVTDSKGCYALLQTTVHIGSASNSSTNNATAGWQAGVLSDNRKVVGSNLAAFGGNIYFTGRDGKIYYYSFSTALSKWVINEIPGISNASIAGANAFTKIGIATVNNVDYLFYTNNAGYLMKINLATNVVDDALNSQTKSTDFIVTTNEIYALVTGTNSLVSNQFTPLPLFNATLKTILPGNGLAYIQNNNLFATGVPYALTATNDVFVSSDVVVYNGWLYYTRGQKGSANLYRMQIAAPLAAEQITISSNLSGVFTINPATGVIYYGVLDLPQNTIYAPSAGSYKAANIYQAKHTNGVWSFNKATTTSIGGIDRYIHSPIYSGNHVYFVGAGRNPNTVGTNYEELEVWNLYYENGCAPAVLRTSAVLNEEESSAEVLVYPNPFVAELTLDLSVYTLADGTSSSVDIEVYDASGKRIHIGVYASEKIQLSTSVWAAGFYVVKIKNKDRVMTKKVIKTN